MQSVKGMDNPGLAVGISCQSLGNELLNCGVCADFRYLVSGLNGVAEHSAGVWSTRELVNVGKQFRGSNLLWSS